MKIYFTADENETITNFRIAEAVINLCNEGYDLNSEAVAKMILLENEAQGIAKQKLYEQGCCERREE